MRLRKRPTQLERVLALAEQGNAAEAAAEKVALAVEGAAPGTGDHKPGCGCARRRCVASGAFAEAAAIARKIGRGI